MKKALISLILILVLAVSVVTVLTVVPIMAAEDNVTASVEVNEYVSVTVTDQTPTGLQFGTLDPGDDVKIPEANTPAVVVTTGTENNKDVEVYLKGTDFAGPGTLTIDNAFYFDSDTPASALPMSATYGVSAWKTLAASQTLNIYHWLTIPNGTTAGSYSSTFTYQTQTAP